MHECCALMTDIADRQRRVLIAVLGINAAMFAVEIAAAVAARSTALLADSVDMLGDAMVYGFSLYVVGRGEIWQARSALVKGTIMAAFAVGVLVEAALKTARGLVPGAELMGVVGVVALAANVLCLALLWRRRDDDLNMKSVWACSRNDVLANAAVLIAAGGVALTGSAWPDVAVGVLIAAMFGTSAVGVLRAAHRQRRPAAVR